MTLREMLIEWQSHQPDLCRIHLDGSVEIVYDGYIAEFDEGEIGGECGYSRAQAMVFAGVCSAIEREPWESRDGFGGIRRRLEYAFRAREHDTETLYTALIIWTNALIAYQEVQLSFTGQIDERGSAMLSAWLKYLNYSHAHRNAR